MVDVLFKIINLLIKRCCYFFIFILLFIVDHKTGILLNVVYNGFPAIFGEVFIILYTNSLSTNFAHFMKRNKLTFDWYSGKSAVLCISNWCATSKCVPGYSIYIIIRCVWDKINSFSFLSSLLVIAN